MIRTSVQDGGIAVVMLDRGEKRNAMTPRMLESLSGAVADLDRMAAAGEIGAIVVGGEGEVFCAGFDLAMCRDDETVLESLLSGLSMVVRGLRRAAVPAVVAAQGAAIAGGCAVLGGADWVVTNAAAKLGYPVVRLGISPAVSAPTLRMLTGDGWGRERMLDPGLVDGREAVRIGLAHECVDEAGQVLERAMAVARELAGKPRGAMRATKRWLNEVDGSAEEEWFDRALGASLGLVGSEEERERLEALWRK